MYQALSLRFIALTLALLALTPFVALAQRGRGTMPGFVTEGAAREHSFNLQTPLLPTNQK